MYGKLNLKVNHYHKTNLSNYIKYKMFMYIYIYICVCKHAYNLNNPKLKKII